MGLIWRRNGTAAKLNDGENGIRRLYYVHYNIVVLYTYLPEQMLLLKIYIGVRQPLKIVQLVSPTFN